MELESSNILNEELRRMIRMITPVKLVVKTARGFYEVGFRNGISQQVDMNYLNRRNMQQELALIALVFLIGSHTLLIKKCFKIEASLPSHFHDLELKANGMDSNITQVRDILDEALDMIAPMLDSPVAQPQHQMTLPESIMSAFLSKLIPPTMMPSSDGSKTQQEERSFFEIDQQTTVETEDEFNELSD